MSPAAGLFHAAERLHRWQHSMVRNSKYRKRGCIRRRVLREIDVIGAAILDIYRLPPPGLLTPDRRAGA